MVKRLFWLILGASFGFGFSFWMAKVVKQTVERYSPERVSSEVADAMRSLGQDFKVAIADGRRAMREQETALRAQVESRNRRRREASPAARLSERGRDLSEFIERA
jgi:hypothetical protein